MTIEPITGKGVNRATVHCCGCDRQETVTCDYERTSGGDWLPNEGQINRKIVGMGWAIVKGKHSCPTCEAKRKAQASAQKETSVAEARTNIAPIRQPTREQRREIRALLDSVYDIEAGRYRGGETDKTVADAIGGGCLYGWVAAERVDGYGDGGENEDMQNAVPDLNDLAARVTEALEKTTKARAAFKLRADEVLDAFSVDIATLNSLKAEVLAAQSKLRAIKAAIGPRAG